MQKLSNTLSITNVSKNKTTREIKKYFEMSENENKRTKMYGVQLKQWRTLPYLLCLKCIRMHSSAVIQCLEVCNCQKFGNSSFNSWRPSGPERLKHFPTVTVLVSGDSVEPRDPKFLHYLWIHHTSLPSPSYVCITPLIFKSFFLCCHRLPFIVHLL